MRDAQIEARTMIEVERMFDEMERKHNLIAKRKRTRMVNAISFALLLAFALVVRFMF